jgi:hypothetical protein
VVLLLRCAAATAGRRQLPIVPRAAARGHVRTRTLVSGDQYRRLYYVAVLALLGTEVSGRLWCTGTGEGESAELIQLAFRLVAD